MPIEKHGVIIETPTEARQAEPGPSILMLLIVSVSLTVLLFGAIGFSSSALESSNRRWAYAEWYSRVQ
jgi:hypothetical protein